MALEEGEYVGGRCAGGSDSPKSQLRNAVRN